jgi:alpha-amylase
MQPYTFSRTYSKERLYRPGLHWIRFAYWQKVLDVSAVFADGTRVRDAYSGKIESIRGKLKQN